MEQMAQYAARKDEKDYRTALLAELQAVYNWPLTGTIEDMGDSTAVTTVDRISTLAGFEGIFVGNNNGAYRMYLRNLITILAIQLLMQIEERDSWYIYNGTYYSDAEIIIIIIMIHL